MAKTQFNPVLIRDQAALAIVYERADREHRNCSNAASVTILEAVGHVKLNNSKRQAKSRRSFREELVEKGGNDGKVC